MTSSLPWMTWATLPVIRSKSSGKVAGLLGGRDRRRLLGSSRLDPPSWSCGALSVGGSTDRTPRGPVREDPSDGSLSVRSGGGPSALAVDIGGTKLAVAHRRRGGCGRRPAPARRPARRPVGRAPLRRARPGWSTGWSTAAGGPAPVVCGVGCGGPMEARRASPCRRSTSRSGGPSRCGRGSPSTPGCPRGSTTTPRPSPWARAGSGAAVGQRDFIAMVVSTGVGGGHRVRRPAARRRRRQRRPHRPRRRRAGRAARARAAAAGCLEAEASGTAIRAITGGDPAAPGPDVVERTGRLVGPGGGVGRQPPRPAARLRGRVGRPRLRRRRSSPPRRPSCSLRARLDFSRARRIIPAGLGRDGPVIGAAAVAWRALGRDIGVAETTTVGSAPSQVAVLSHLEPARRPPRPRRRRAGSRPRGVGLLQAPVRLSMRSAVSQPSFSWI